MGGVIIKVHVILRLRYSLVYVRYTGHLLNLISPDDRIGARDYEAAGHSYSFSHTSQEVLLLINNLETCGSYLKLCCYYCLVI